MSEVAFSLTVYDGSASADVFDEAVALYREVYVEPPYLEGEDDVAEFADSLPRRAEQKNFRLVIARRGREPLGFAFGHQLPPATLWWDGALTSISTEVTTEHEGRTFAVIEIAVVGPYRRRRIGRRLHAHLMADRAEERATLLVRPDAKPAHSAYVEWGYRKVGQIRPFSRAPIYDVMISP